MSKKSSIFQRSTSLPIIFLEKTVFLEIPEFFFEGSTSKILLLFFKTVFSEMVTFFKIFFNFFILTLIGIARATKWNFLKIGSVLWGCQN